MNIKKIIISFPIIFPIGAIILIVVDVVLHDYNPMNGEQGLGTIGIIFFSATLGVVVSAILLLAMKLMQKFFK